jgi:hypothetical protein
MEAMENMNIEGPFSNIVKSVVVYLCSISIGLGLVVPVLAWPGRGPGYAWFCLAALAFFSGVALGRVLNARIHRGSAVGQLAFLAFAIFAADEFWISGMFR